MLFVSISFALGSQHKCSFQWNMGYRVPDLRSPVKSCFPYIFGPRFGQFYNSSIVLPGPDFSVSYLQHLVTNHIPYTQKKVPNHSISRVLYIKITSYIIIL